ncbi:DUF1559 domain-containing protein [Pirellulales bacterium]|nr:DUF1559 domain-containing protein [Pirellulales bacterium]
MARRGFTLLELIVVTAVIGALVALLAPAVQSAREAGRRTECKNQLRQVGIALNAYHATHGAYPVGCDQWRPWGNEVNRQLAWSAFILPFLEQRTLYGQLDLGRPFDDAVNSEPSRSRLSIYLCPSADPEAFERPSGRGASHYGGIFGQRITGPNNPPRGVMRIDRPTRIREIEDGLAWTLIVGEDTRFPDGEWINGRNLFDQAYAVNAAPVFENDLWSQHPGGALGLACDASVHFLSEATDLEVLAALCTRAGDEPIGRWP